MWGKLPDFSFPAFPEPSLWNLREPAVSWAEPREASPVKASSPSHRGEAAPPLPQVWTTARANSKVLLQTGLLQKRFALWSFSLFSFQFSWNPPPMPGSCCAFLCRNEMVNISFSKKGFPQSSRESKADTCWTHSEMEIVGPGNHLNLTFLSAASCKMMETKKVESYCLRDSK